MKQVTLTGTTVTTSQLGFGCAGLMRLPTEAERQRLLATAFEQGIRHFDAARMYGLGKVEGSLGAFTHSRRDQVTITTKFGIPLSAAASRLGGMQSLLRRLIGASPALRQIVRRRSQALYKEQSFSIADARESLETSLRELKTEYVDIYLLHECSVNGLQNGEDLHSFLEEARNSGKIRCYGIATTFDKTIDICRQFPQYAPVAQFDNDVVSRNITKLPPSSERALITHSAFSQALPAIAKAFAADSGLVRQWSETIGLDCSDKATLSALLLGYCLQMNPTGIVLFHSGTAPHIAANIRAAGDTGPSFEAIRLFSNLIETSQVSALEPAAS